MPALQITAAADNRGQTVLLHGASLSGDGTALVQVLADRGARLGRSNDRWGMTPIDSAMGRAGGNNGFGRESHRHP